MPFDKNDFTIGIEEEYLIVDPVSRDLVADPPQEMFRACETALGGVIGQVSPEFMRSQIEIGTRVCRSLQEARETLSNIRGTISTIARAHDVAIMAASTHPFGEWTAQAHTDRDRYNVLAQDLQVVVRRLLICGMHIHVGIPDDDVRMDIINQARYFLPHLLALSTSSPFWQGLETGLKSYRLSVFDELPRTGLPPQFDSFGEYQRTVDVLVKAGVIEDATKIWWDLRPSARFPTVEFRLSDMCPLMEDALCIAALFACICRMLLRLRRQNQRWRSYNSFLLDENRWRAQRYGTGNGMIDFGRGEIVPFAELMDELLQLIAEDAEALDAMAEVNHVHQIMARGTSADRQLKTYQSALDLGSSKSEALKTVVDLLVSETLRDTSAAPSPASPGTAYA
jgi:carboxylate-amine ligase